MTATKCSLEYSEYSWKSWVAQPMTEVQTYDIAGKGTTLTFQEPTCGSSKHSRESPPEGAVEGSHILQCTGGWSWKVASQ